MSNKRKPSYPIHKNGKHCGYEEFEDGSIEVARAHSEKMATLNHAEAAVHSMLDAITRQCHALLNPIEAGKREFWDSLKDDYGLDFDKYDYSYNGNKRVVSRKEKEQKK